MLFNLFSGKSINLKEQVNEKDKMVNIYCWLGCITNSN